MYMKTENEKAKLKSIEEQLSQIMLSLNIQINGEDIEEIDPALKATFVGIPLSMLDALFAIRDNEPWRDITDPREIAREMLRTSSIGE